ncbi:hypothetical protein HDU78_010994 [Chytriomyces hyalinus]|nr:hypothetical protein HDU78_010994 [Chytriomyces hyalinus]
MPRYCATPSCVEFSRIVLADVISLRSEVYNALQKADHLIEQLGGRPPVSQGNVRQHRSDPNEEDEEMMDAGNYLDLGLRLNAVDYAVSAGAPSSGDKHGGLFSKMGRKEANIPGSTTSKDFDIDTVLSGETTQTQPPNQMKMGAARRASLIFAPTAPVPEPETAIDIDNLLGMDIDDILGVAPPTFSAAQVPAPVASNSNSSKETASSSIYSKKGEPPSSSVRTFGPKQFQLSSNKSSSVNPTQKNHEPDRSKSSAPKEPVSAMLRLQVLVESTDSYMELPEGGPDLFSSANMLKKKVEDQVAEYHTESSDLETTTSKESHDDPSSTANSNTSPVLNATPNQDNEKGRRSLPDGTSNVSDTGHTSTEKMKLSEVEPEADELKTPEVSHLHRSQSSATGVQRKPLHTDGNESKSASVSSRLVSSKSTISKSISFNNSMPVTQEKIPNMRLSKAKSKPIVSAMKPDRDKAASTVKSGAISPQQSKKVVSTEKLSPNQARSQLKVASKSGEALPAPKEGGSAFSFTTEETGLLDRVKSDLSELSDRSNDSEDSNAPQILEESRKHGLGRTKQDGSNWSIASTHIPRYTFASLRLDAQPGVPHHPKEKGGEKGSQLAVTLARSVTNSSVHSILKQGRPSVSPAQRPSMGYSVASAAPRLSVDQSRMSLARSFRRPSEAFTASESFPLSKSRRPSMLRSYIMPSPAAETETTSQAPSSIPNIVFRKTDINLSLSQRYLCLVLLPAYDNKGRSLNLDQFDDADFEAISFQINGLHPKSYILSMWDFAISVLYVLWIYFLPLVISFRHTFSSFSMNSLSLWTTTLFAIDTLTNMLTPQPKNVNPMGNFREYELERPALNQWIQAWVRKSMILEIVSLVPFEFIFRHVENSEYLLLLGILRIYRIPTKISRNALFAKVRLSLERMMGMGFFKVLPIAFGIFFLAHVDACVMYLIGRQSGFTGWAATWPQFEESNMYQIYTWTLFQALGNIFPMSFKPQTAVEQAIAIVFIVVGAVLYAAFVGYVSSAAISINPSGRLYNQKIEELIDYVKWKNLGEETKEKLISYYETKYRGKFFEEDTLLTDMNESLREEIALHNTQRLIEKVPFLQRYEADGRDEIFYHRIASVLHARYFIPGDFIIKQGDSGNEMYFILSGKVNVFVNGTKVVSLYDGAYIGEVSLITRHLRTATVMAVLPSVLYKLTRHDFQAVIDEFPDMKSRIDKLARDAERMVRQAEERS